MNAHVDAGILLGCVLGDHIGEILLVLQAVVALLAQLFFVLSFKTSLVGQVQVLRVERNFDAIVGSALFLLNLRR